MQFGLTETQQTLKNSARKFLAAECPIAEVRRLMETDTAHDEALWKKMAEQGWMGLLIPEEYGGYGMGMMEMAVVLEEMGRALLPGPYFSTVLLAGGVIARAAEDHHRGGLLTAIARGERKGTLALLEDSASWDIGAVQLQAGPRGGGYTLRGRKLFVTDADVTDCLVCAARAGAEIALFLIDVKAAGVAVRPMRAMDGTRKLYALNFDAVKLLPESLIAWGDRAAAAVEDTLEAAAAGLAAEMTGGMQRVLDMAVEYAKTRKQFGKPIGSFQAVQHQCADMLVLTESSRAAAHYAAFALDGKLPGAAAAVSVAKAYASDAYREVGNRGIQVHGGMGFTWENDVHLYYRRAKASEIAFGDATFHRERIARAMLNGASPKSEDREAARA